MYHDLTINELKDRIIASMDTTDLIEALDIGIVELAEAFTDKIEDYYERLIEELDESLEDQEEESKDRDY